MRVFIPVQPNLLVEWGHRHPIALESCGSLVAAEEVVLFRAAPAKVERLSAEAEETNIADLVDVAIHSTKGLLAPPEERPARTVETLEVDLRLARMPRASAASQALLIGIDRLEWFVRLVYLLPAAVLRTYEAVIADPYIIVVNRRGVHGIPFGQPMTELYPQLFVPVGMQLIPRVDYELLREHLEIRPDQSFYFFPEDAPAFSVPLDALRPLSRAVVAAERARANLLSLKARDIVESLERPQITHVRQGAFSLWRGARVERGTNSDALPAPSTLPPRRLTAGDPEATEPDRLSHGGDGPTDGGGP